ncbi:MAG: peptidoglycan-binding protein [Acidobacteriia bacterium]|nr:peptidoglycan-binding protein [Terriglobia bacterium]
MGTLKQGDRGAPVIALQNALAARGFNPGGVDGDYGPATAAAVRAFQRSAGLTPDGAVGSATAAALGLQPPAAVVSLIPCVTAEMAAQIVAGAPRANVEQHLPYVLNALVAPQLADKAMIAMALSTIRAETGAFLPISEGRSQYNTSPGGHNFDLYDGRQDLGNQGPPDGAAFKGRGFIQLTGRANYAEHGAAIGLGDGLLRNPELANDPDIAARLLASFLKAHETRIRVALSTGDLAAARKAVNGGSHGLDDFSRGYRTAQAVLPDQIVVVKPVAQT